MAPHALSDAIQDYLRQIYLLGQDGSRVSTSALARRQKVSPASASAMVKKLAALGLVEHARYRGVVLTQAGERVAVEVVRHHRLLELYLAEALGIAVDDVHAEADRLEHALSEELEARIDRALGYPTHDPHGDPIPDADLQWPAGRGGGAGAVVRRVRAGDGPAIRELRLRALRADPDAFASTLEREEAYTDEDWREWAAEDVAGPAGATFLAFLAGAPVGLVGGYRSADDGRFRIVAMWVAPEARRRGIGRRLLDAVEGWIAASGGDAAWLAVADRAPAARRLYERAGYAETGERSESPRTPGVLHVELRKRLGSREDRRNTRP